jgi:siroheme decarboxylase
MKLDDIDKDLLALAEGDVDVSERPFDAWAGELGIPVEEVISRLQTLKQAGVIRAVKAVLRHRQAGFTSNAMVVWSVPESQVDVIGPKIASFHAVSHCYERSGFGNYNVFSMIHARSDDEVMEAVSTIAHAVGISDYQIFWSLRELKKTSMRYFHLEGSCDE